LLEEIEEEEKLIKLKEKIEFERKEELLN